MKTTYENLFEKVDSLLNSVEKIQKTLEKPKSNKPPNKNLSLEKALNYLSENGIIISKSKIYKLTSNNSIPFKRFGNRLIFNTNELNDWMTKTLKNKEEFDFRHIVKSAQNKL